MDIMNKIQISILLFFLLFFNTLILAQKTDKLYLLNGDELTCEIKTLEYGMLTAKTDDIGTLSIKWDKISRITSKEYFEIELSDGSKYFGPIVDSKKKQVLRVLLFDSSMVDLDMENIVEINQIMEQFLSRINGKVDMGFDIMKANSLSKLTLGANVGYRYKSNFVSITWNSVYTEQQDTIQNQRADLDIRYNHSYKNKWILEAYSTFQNNSELGLDLRILAGGGPGRNLIRTNHISFNVLLGTVYSKEWNVGVKEATTNLEGWTRLEFRQFIHSTPKIDILSTVEYFPNLTTKDRHRIEFYTNAKREIISDLSLILKIQYSYDSKNPSSGSPTDDWVFTIGMSYTI